MTTDIDVIIAVHDGTRPIERAVRSVLDARDPDRVRIIVVCHEIGLSAVREKLGRGDEEHLRLIDFSDGVHSAAGPFNRGLDEASAEYVCVMGSDDYLEAGAIDTWLDHVDSERPAAALARLRYQNGPLLHNPLARPRRSRDLDVVKDRLFYRTAPLGLVRRDVISRLGLRFREGLRTGDDLEFGVRLWSSGQRIDYLRDLPGYVIGSDASTRVTTSPMSIEESFEAIDLLTQESFVAALPSRVRRSLAIKLIRIHILGTLARRGDEELWRDDEEIAHACATFQRVLAMGPSALSAFSRADRAVLTTISREDADIADVVASVKGASDAGFVDRNVTKNPLKVLGRESVLRRYLVYALSR